MKTIDLGLRLKHVVTDVVRGCRRRRAQMGALARQPDLGVQSTDVALAHYVLRMRGLRKLMSCTAFKKVLDEQEPHALVGRTRRPTRRSPPAVRRYNSSYILLSILRMATSV